MTFIELLHLLLPVFAGKINHKMFSAPTSCDEIYFLAVKVKVKSSMAKSLPVENLLPQNVCSIINYFR